MTDTDTRWAKAPPDCEAMDAADKHVWDTYPELKGRKLKRPIDDPLKR